MQSDLLHILNIYQQHQNITHWAVSYRIFKKGNFFINLIDGKSCTMKSYETAITWFDHHWPSDLTWPNHIPRPSRVTSIGKGRRKKKPINLTIKDTARYQEGA